MPVRKPNFLVIGGQRCGSTWLYEGLAQHPDIYMSRVKEPGFFDTKSRLKRGIQHYLDTHFNDVSDQKAVGEATPGYFWCSAQHPEWLEPGPDQKNRNRAIPKTIREHLGPEVRLLLILRDPVKRAVSAFLHHARLGRVRLESGLLDAGKQHGIIHMGFYHAHLQEWLDVFPEEQLCCFVFEEAVRRPNAAFQQCFRHLGVDPNFQVRHSEQQQNAGFERAEHEGAIYIRKADLGSNSISNRLRRFISRRLALAPDLNPNAFQLAAEPSELCALYQIYEQDTAGLESWLGSPLTAWRQNRVKAEAWAGGGAEDSINEKIRQIPPT